MSNDEKPLFSPGDTCYDREGNQLQYVAFVNNQHYALRLYEDGDGNSFNTDPVALKTVYAVAPVQVKDSAIKALNEQIEILRRQLSEKQTKALKLDAKLRGLDRKFADSLARIKECEELANIDLFLAGGITHFVMGDGSDTIIKTFDEAICYIDSDDKKTYQRLLSLYGDQKRKVQWGIAHYGDGSGKYQKAIPFASYEEALKNAVEIHIGKLNGMRKYDFHNYAHMYRTWVISAENLGVEIPADIAEFMRVRNIKLAKEELERLEKAHHKAAVDVASARTKVMDLEGEQSGS